MCVWKYFLVFYLMQSVWLGLGLLIISFFKNGLMTIVESDPLGQVDFVYKPFPYSRLNV